MTRFHILLSVLVFFLLGLAAVHGLPALSFGFFSAAVFQAFFFCIADRAGLFSSGLVVNVTFEVIF